MKIAYISMGLVGFVAILVMLFIIPTLSEIKNLETYVLLALIITEVMIFLTNYKIENKRHFLDKREKHTQLLVVNAYQKLVDVYPFQTGHVKCEIGYPHNIVDYMMQKLDPFSNQKEITYITYKMCIVEPYLTWSLKHLEKYDNVFKHWKEGNSLLNKYNELLQSFNDLVNKEIIRVLGVYFGGFTDQIVAPDKNYYQLFSINKLIYHTLLNTILKPTFQLEKINHEMYSIEAKGFGMLIQSNNEIDLELFRECLGIVYDNVIESFNNMDFIRSKSYDEFKEFRKELEVLVAKLNAGMPIEGQCELPY